MQRPKGQTVEDHEAMRKRITERLLYLDRANLMTLAEIIISHAQGRPPVRVWSEALILSEARALQGPPVEEQRIVTSWLASREGPAAVAAGFEVELFRHLRRSGRPPSAYDARRIREDAESNARRVELIRERLARDAASADDRGWLEAYMRDRQAVRRIVAEGERARATAAKGQAA